MLYCCILLSVDVPYEITVYTSDKSNSGTDANVFIALYGMGGASTEQVELTESKKKKRKECFNKGSVDVFVREVRRTVTYDNCVFLHFILSFQLFLLLFGLLPKDLSIKISSVA